MKKLKLFFRLIGPRVVLPILMGTCILLCCPQNAYSTNTSNSQNLQEKVSLSGIVIDEFNNSVIGASLVEVGTSNWTITDNDGKFSLSVPIGASIKVSFIGFKDQIIKVNSKAKLTIKLIQDAQVLNDVVVVGFGTQKKINLTGSVAVVDDKEISSRPISN
ncbi:MAG: carboxypeptidase-like regulatory domain-containing protein, partial [Bacteroidales bacterium]